MSRALITRLLALSAACGLAGSPVRGAEKASLRVAVFECDVTPPLGEPVYSGYQPLAVIEHPLLAKGIVLDDGQRLVAGVDRLS